MRDEVLLGAIGVLVIGAMTIAISYITGRDETLLGIAAGAIGTVIGLVLRGGLERLRGTRVPPRRT